MELRNGLMLLFFSYLCWTEERVIARSCKSTIVTSNPIYNEFLPIKKQGDSTNILLKFYVASATDANVLLSPILNPSKTDSVYEIVIGGYDNSRTLIRQHVNSTDMVTVSTPGLLSNREYRGFWVKLSDKRLIQVGKIGDLLPFAFYNAPKSVDIKYFSFSSWWDNTGVWDYDCDDENGLPSKPIERKKLVEKTCKSTMVTSNPIYNEFLPIKKQGDSTDVLMKFYVASATDANVLLSPILNPSKTDSVYEIVIGGYDNSRTLIRQHVNGTDMVTVSTPGLLSNREYRGFWVKLSDKGLIQVGKIGDFHPFVVWYALQPVDVKYFSFSSWWGFTGVWVYYCDDEKDW